MRKTALTIMTGLALAASAQAGEDYSAKAPTPVPAPDPCLWTWFAGGSGGYVDDIDNDMYTLHVGAEYKCPGSESSHAIFLEVGWTSWSESDLFDDMYDYRYDIDFDYSVVPITINYKYENRLFGAINWYVGAGLGIAISSIDVDLPGSSFDWDDSETNFFGQAFIGLVWNVSDSFEVFGGARYLYMDGTDKISTDGLHDDGDLVGILDNDIFYELGLRFNF